MIATFVQNMYQAYKEINMFTKIKVWWMLRCFKKSLEKSPEMQALKKRMEACIERNKESDNESN